MPSSYGIAASKAYSAAVLEDDDYFVIYRQGSTGVYPGVASCESHAAKSGGLDGGSDCRKGSALVCIVSGAAFCCGPLCCDASSCCDRIMKASDRSSYLIRCSFPKWGSCLLSAWSCYYWGAK